MMKKDKKGKESLNEVRVALLLEDFFEGRTTVEEEELLTDYFAGDNVSPLFSNYTPLFRGLGAVKEKKNEAKFHIIRKFGWWSVSVAAMLAIIVTLGGSLYMKSEFTNEVAALYDGSYVIEGGKKITDLSVIMPKLHRAEASAETMIPALGINVSTEGLDADMQETISEILNF